MEIESRKKQSSFLVIFISFIFIVCWGSGYIAAVFTKNAFAPFNLLFARYILTTFLLFWILAIKYRTNFGRVLFSAWNKTQLTLGILYHVAYIGCVFYAVKLGLSAGAAAAIFATQPLVTVLIECGLNRRGPGGRVVVGAIVCFAGSLLLSRRTVASDATPEFIPMLIAGIGVLAIAIATVIHTRVVSQMEIWPSLFVQFSAATISIAGLLFIGVEPLDITFNIYNIFSVIFLVFVTTIGSYLTMNWLVANMDPIKYPFLFFIVPPSVFIFEYLLFKNTFSYYQFSGCIIALLGVHISLSSSNIQKFSKGDAND